MRFIDLGTLFKWKTHLIRCIAGQIKRNFGSKDILKLVVNKILSVKSDATQSRLIFLLHAVRFLYSREINKLRGIIKFAIYGSFTGSVFSRLKQPSNARSWWWWWNAACFLHFSKIPSVLLNVQPHFASLLELCWICHFYEKLLRDMEGSRIC